MIIPNLLGLSFGLFLWGVLWWLHFHDECPTRHTILIAMIATSQMALSSGLILRDPQAWMILGYFLLTCVGLAIAFEGRYKMLVEESTDIELTTEITKDN
jgi:uncharacterized membrane protein